HFGDRLRPLVRRRALMGLARSFPLADKPRRSPTRSGTSTTDGTRFLRSAPLKRVRRQCKDLAHAWELGNLPVPSATSADSPAKAPAPATRSSGRGLRLRRIRTIAFKHWTRSSASPHSKGQLQTLLNTIAESQIKPHRRSDAGQATRVDVPTVGPHARESAPLTAAAPRVGSARPRVTPLE